MRILHLIDSGGLYGAERMLLALVEEQIRQGLEPMILSAGELDEREKPLEAEAKRLGLPLTPWRMRSGMNFLVARRILQWARLRRYQLLHSHGYKFNILLGSYPSPLKGLPLICTLHGYVAARFPSRLWFYERADRIALSGADSIVVVNRVMKGVLPKYLHKRIKYIPNGIPSTPPETSPLPSEITDFMRGHTVNVIAAGRLSYEKGFDLLIDALAGNCDGPTTLGLVLFGAGKEKPHLERRIRQRRIQHIVKLTGYRPNLSALMPHFDALVMPSRTEGLPMLLLEAMRVDLPIIATRVGGIPDILHDVPSARLINPNDTQALTSALRDLALRHAEDNGLRTSNRRFFSRYTSSIMAGHYSTLYAEHVTGLQRPRHNPS